MKKVKLLYLILSIVVLGCTSCKKQSDTAGPQITITKPYQNQMFYMYDDIAVRANICDDHNISTIEVSVTDESYTTVMIAPTIYAENNCQDVSLSIPINNIYLPSGFYYLVIRASDGSNETKKFLKIHITTLPKKLKYLIVVSKNAGQINISKIDSTNTLIPLKSLTTDYCGSAVSSDAQQFYIAGRYSGDVSVFSTIDWQLQWSIPVIVSPPFPYFEAIAVHNKQLYVSYRQGKFEVYNAAGSIRAQRTIDEGNYPTKFTPFDDFLITYERSPSESIKQMVVYYTPSYSIQQENYINFSIRNIFNKDKDNCIVFCNYADHATIALYTISTHTFWNSYTIPSGNIISVASIDKTNFLYISNNNVYWYSYQNTSSVSVNSGLNIQHLVYDETTEEYYFSEDYHTVKKYIFLHSGLQSSVYVPDTILNILPVYNKD
jgi:hypothetical protein